MSHQPNHEFNRLINGIAESFDIGVSDIISYSRKAEFVRAREITIYFARDVLRMSYPMIAWRIGNRNHTSILHLYKNVKNKLEKDSNFKEFLSSIREKIKGKLKENIEDDVRADKKNTESSQREVKNKFLKEHEDLLQNTVRGRHGHIWGDDAGQHSVQNVSEKSKNFLQTQIYDLSFSTRTLNVMEKNKLLTMSDLLKMSKEELYNIEGMGQKGIKEIKKAVGNFGFILGGGIDWEHLEGNVDSIIEEKKRLVSKNINRGLNYPKILDGAILENKGMRKGSAADDPRTIAILNRWRQGFTLEEIGKEFSVTRERVRQIVKKGIYREIEVIVDSGIPLDVEEFFNDQKTIHQKEKEKRSGKSVTANKPAKEKRWSKFYDRCRMCGTTAVHHRSHGYCRRCYYKTTMSKEMQEASRLRNLEKWKESTRKYQNEYKNRPEVQEKMRKKHDLINFGGNREKAIARDNYQCTMCGITRDESKRQLNRDLFVDHINKGDNDLDNLITVCKKCHSKIWTRRI